MPATGMELHIVVSETGGDAQQIDALTAHLIRDLRALGVESVHRTPLPPPDAGAKGAGTSTGALDVVAMPSIADRLLGMLRAWASRGQRTVRIETPDGLKLEFTPEKQLTPQEMVAFVQALGSHSTPPSPYIVDDAVARRRQQLHELLVAHFNESELRTLCFHLGISYEDLDGSNRGGKIIALIEYGERHRGIDALLRVGRTVRADVPWDDVPTRGNNDA